MKCINIRNILDFNIVISDSMSLYAQQIFLLFTAKKCQNVSMNRNDFKRIYLSKLC